MAVLLEGNDITCESSPLNPPELTVGERLKVVPMLLLLAGTVGVMALRDRLRNMIQGNDVSK